VCIVEGVERVYGVHALLVGQWLDHKVHRIGGGVLRNLALLAQRVLEVFDFALERLPTAPSVFANYIFPNIK
jgi:hypothetical protein